MTTGADLFQVTPRHFGDEPRETESSPKMMDSQRSSPKRHKYYLEPREDSLNQR